MNKSATASIIFFVAMAAATTLFAHDKDVMKKIEIARIALITERLGRSTKQGPQFVPF